MPHPLADEGRRRPVSMVRDHTLIFRHCRLEDGDLAALLPIFDAMSCFQHMVQAKVLQLIDASQPNGDGRVILDPSQQQDLERNGPDQVRHR
jgi:hypothetical protein